MKNKISPKKIIVIWAAIMVFAIGVYFLQKKKSHAPESSTQTQMTDAGEGPCPGETVELEMQDVYMRGVLEEGAQFKAVMNWYACNPLKKGDIVLYRYNNVDAPVVRRVVAVSDDDFKLVFDKKDKDWQLEVNGDLVKAVDGAPYKFGGAASPPLKLYENATKGKVSGRDVIVFSAFPPGHIDSGMFGAVAIKDIVGKVTLNK